MAILTISREYGSGGKEIGQAVSELMGYQYIDRQRILEDMGKVGPQWEEQAKYFDEIQPSTWERYKWSFRGFVALNQYHILNYALQDNVVIMGRGGNFLLKEISYALRVRTVAPIEKRIETVMKWEGETSSEHARWLIEKADKDMAGTVYMIYGSQWDDPKQYDMVFDTGILSYDEIISSIKDKLKKKEQFKTEETKKVLKLKVLAAKIKADIAINTKFFISSLNVDFKEKGLVKYGLILRGVVHDQNDIKHIEDKAKELSGDVPIECDIQYRMYQRRNPLKFK